MNPYDVLKKPIISEKSNTAREIGFYTFEIDKKATKDDVKAAAKKVFGVNVEKVRTVITRGKFKRRGAYYSLKPKLTKKAILKLAKGESLGQVFAEES